ncbi:MAG: selenocysteine-specific translation elongation factor, partial [bacterium]|nr:selenocysteine-specific translation elongation factor [bacterium]
MRHCILGTAGHVDHGKTALIGKLTGTQTDRLKEEQERGISIELGFAELSLSDSLTLGVVDVPGHEKFVKQMVAGAGGVDLAMLIIAADEGVMPQTIEHLEILSSLGVSGGAVVITKSDLVDPEMAELAAEEAMELVEGTFLEDRPIITVSAITGDGIDELKNVLIAEVEALPDRSTDGGFRLPVDRVFTMPGAGVIVTGTCWSGSVKIGDSLVLEPDAIKVRVRDVQAHGSKVDSGYAGQRLAIALNGVKKDELGRGYQLASPDFCQMSRRLDARLNLVPHFDGYLKNRQRVHIHHAGREVLARVVLLDKEELANGIGEKTAL